MGKHLREDKTCLNCYYVVEKRFCSNCGQENSTPQKSFHHLFTHFVEDLVHYDSSFQRTVRTLLFKPAQLTKEYLSGRRQTYVPPVKLYIFINFLTFFLISLLPSNLNDEIKLNSKQGTAVTEGKKADKDPGLVFGDYRSIKELEEAEAKKKPSERMEGLRLWMSRKFAMVQEKHTPVELRKEFTKSFIGNLPKVLFLYMPLFALALWLFHGKRRWYYFDHGIFTLHYFSFMLLTFSAYLALESLASSISEDLEDVMIGLLLALFAWWFFYFFRSHRRFYGESKLVSRLKSTFLFVINLIFIMFMLILAMLYAVLNIA